MASNINLTPSTPLNGFTLSLAGTTLSEPAFTSLVSVALAQDDNGAGHAALQAEFEAAWPSIGHSSKGKQSLWLGLQQHACFGLLNITHEKTHGITAINATQLEHEQALHQVQQSLGSSAYITDQSDSWAMLMLEGELSEATLERICMLDLHLEACPVGSVARTTMEHLAVMMVRTQPNAFLLMSPRSSASSFLHAVELSLKNVAG